MDYEATETRALASRELAIHGFIQVSPRQPRTAAFLRPFSYRISSPLNYCTRTYVQIITVTLVLRYLR